MVKIGIDARFVERFSQSPRNDFTIYCWLRTPSANSTLFLQLNYTYCGVKTGFEEYIDHFYKWNRDNHYTFGLFAEISRSLSKQSQSNIAMSPITFAA